jgi:hypothetical protein
VPEVIWGFGDLAYWIARRIDLAADRLSDGGHAASEYLAALLEVRERRADERVAATEQASTSALGVSPVRVPITRLPGDSMGP